MIFYQLICGTCGNLNYVSAADLAAIEWKCTQFGHLNTSSMPTKPDGTLLTKEGEATAIIKDTSIPVGKTVVVSDKVGTDEKSKLPQESSK